MKMLRKTDESKNTGGPWRHSNRCDREMQCPSCVLSFILWELGVRPARAYETEHANVAPTERIQGACIAFAELIPFGSVMLVVARKTTSFVVRTVRGFECFTDIRRKGMFDRNLYSRQDVSLRTKKFIMHNVIHPEHDQAQMCMGQ